MQQTLPVERQEEAVPAAAWPPAGSADPLQESGDAARGVDLDDPVEVAHVDSQFERAGGHDDAVPFLRERLLGPSSLVDRERGVGEERRHVERPQPLAEFLDQGTGVAEHEPFLTPVQGRDHLGRVVHGPDVVQLDLAGRLPYRRRDARSRTDVGSNHPPRPLAPAGALQPAQQLIGIADRRGETDPLHRATRHPGEAFQNGQQVPTPVVSGERVHLVDHDRAKLPEELVVVHGYADQHRLQGFRSGEQDVGAFPENGPAPSHGHVAVPERGTAAEPAGVGLQPGQEVVEQGLQRAHVEHGGARPVLLRHPGQQRKRRRLGLAAGGGREEQSVLAVQERSHGGVLQRP